MRLGLVLREPVADDAARAQELGFGLVWIDDRVVPAPLVAAAAVAQRAPAVRIAAAVSAGVHPVTLAEEAAVADLCCAGRLVLVLRSDDAALLLETVTVLRLAWGGRPFRHRGARWRVPAALPEHHEAEPLVRVTPPPDQLDLPVWLEGTAAPQVAVARGLPVVAGPGSPEATTAPPHAGRPGRFAVAGLDPDELTARLVEARDAHGVDVALLELPGSQSDEERAAWLRRVAGEVRPRLQIAQLPDGLETFWHDHESDAQ